MSYKEDYLVILWQEETQEGGWKTPRKCGNSLKNNLGQFDSPIEDNKKMKKKSPCICLFCLLFYLQKSGQCLA